MKTKIEIIGRDAKAIEAAARKIQEAGFFAAEKAAGTLQGAIKNDPAAAVRTLGALEVIRINCEEDRNA